MVLMAVEAVALSMVAAVDFRGAEGFAAAAARALSAAVISARRRREATQAARLGRLPMHAAAPARTLAGCKAQTASAARATASQMATGTRSLARALVTQRSLTASGTHSAARSPDVRLARALRTVALAATASAGIPIVVSDSAAGTAVSDGSALGGRCPIGDLGGPVIRRGDWDIGAGIRSGTDRR